MLKRVYLKDLEEITDNKYIAVCVAAKRARQLSEGARTTIDIDAAKESTIALHELAEGKLSYSFKEIEAAEEVEEISEEELLETEEEFEDLFKEEYVDDSGEEYEDEEPEEGL